MDIIGAVKRRCFSRQRFFIAQKIMLTSFSRRRRWWEKEREWWRRDMMGKEKEKEKEQSTPVDIIDAVKRRYFSR